MMKEAIMIEKQNNEVSMNGKNDLGRGNLVKLVARRSENGLRYPYGYWPKLE